MRKNLNYLMALMLTASLFTGCGANNNIEADENTISTNEEVDESAAGDIEEGIAEKTDSAIEENAFKESAGQITSGPGAVYDGVLYYAVDGGGCHTGIIARDLSTGEEKEIISSDGTNGFSSISIYDGYIYCSWDKYVGTDDNEWQIYRFSLEDYNGEYIADGSAPIVANNTLYYWTFVYEMGIDSDYEYATLHKFDLDSFEEIEEAQLQHPTFGVEDGYIYQYMYDYFYFDGEIIVAIKYEELGEYDEAAGGYLWNENDERGIRLYDMDGNEKDINDYDVKYLDYYSDGSPYGVDIIYSYSKVMRGGELVEGIVGDDEVMNYIAEDGTITTLQSWMPAE